MLSFSETQSSLNSIKSICKNNQCTIFNGLVSLGQCFLSRADLRTCLLSTWLKWLIFHPSISTASHLSPSFLSFLIREYGNARTSRTTCRTIFYEGTKEMNGKVPIEAGCLRLYILGRAVFILQYPFCSDLRQLLSASRIFGICRLFFSFVCLSQVN